MIVAIIGKGSTGTYAVRLQKNFKKSVIVVEKAGVLGDHINAYSEAL
jgi:pyruvate/2-oxoglutarate dehydrogenase complex dihydrolipoamide dehydrogenase (E3) component